MIKFLKNKITKKKNPLRHIVRDFVFDSFTISISKQPPFRYCSYFQLKAVKEALGLLGSSVKPFSKAVGGGRISSFTGFMRPSVFERSLSGLNRIKFNGSISEQIDTGYVVILLVGRAYSHHHEKIDKLKGLFFQHYISIWGYDDEYYYIYDTAAPREILQSDGLCKIKKNILEYCWDLGGGGLLKKWGVAIKIIK